MGAEMKNDRFHKFEIFQIISNLKSQMADFPFSNCQLSIRHLSFPLASRHCLPPSPIPHLPSSIFHPPPRGTPHTFEI
jgi:hypothetical protein